MRSKFHLAAVGHLVLLTACAFQSAAPTSTNGTQAVSVTASGPSRLTLATQNDVNVLATKLQVGPGVGGIGGDHRFMSNAPLVLLDGRGQAHPHLASEIPSRDRGTWIVRPDGTMATTWKLRSNALWHDGQPVTSGDFVFALQVYLDPEIEVIHHHPERFMERIEPLDDKTFIIHWNQLYLWANRLITEQLEPLPEHVLRPLYERADKAAFQNAPFWTTPSYVSTGPFVLADRVEGVQRLYRAFDRYFLGRAKIDEVTVRMMPDQNTVLANVLSGAIDATTSVTLNQQAGLTLQREWERTGEGYLVNSLATFIFSEFQHHPERTQAPALLDVRVRRAIAHAIDRVALNETVSGGRAPTPEVPMHPDAPLSPRALQVSTKHLYDPGRALALLAEAGWSKQGDKLANASGESFRLNIRTVGRADNETVVRIMASDLVTLGMDVTQTTLTVAEDADRAQRATFPGMGINTVQPMDVPEGLRYFISEECPRSETRFVGANRGCWTNPEFDRLYRIAITSIDEQARVEPNLQMLQLLTQDAAMVPLTYYIHNVAVRKGLVGPTPHWHTQRGSTWNIHEWYWS
jgi:peptide/nickel transport system substrate-binding protein